MNENKELSKAEMKSVKGGTEEVIIGKHLSTCDGWVVPGILCEGCAPKPKGE